MKRKLLPLGLSLLVIAACDPGGAELSEGESVVPPGAIPAAPDYRPDRDAPEAAGSATPAGGDTSLLASPAVPPDTGATGAEGPGPVQPR